MFSAWLPEPGTLPALFPGWARPRQEGLALLSQQESGQASGSEAFPFLSPGFPAAPSLHRVPYSLPGDLAGGGSQPSAVSPGGPSQGSPSARLLAARRPLRPWWTIIKGEKGLRLQEGQSHICLWSPGTGCQSQPLSALCPSPSSPTSVPQIPNPAATWACVCCVPLGHSTLKGQMVGEKRE